MLNFLQALPDSVSEFQFSLTHPTTVLAVQIPVILKQSDAIFLGGGSVGPFLNSPPARLSIRTSISLTPSIVLAIQALIYSRRSYIIFSLVPVLEFLKWGPARVPLRPTGLPEHRIDGFC